MSPTRVVFGFHAVTVLLRQRPESVLELHTAAGRADGRMRDLLKLAGQKGVRVMVAPGERLDGLAGHGRHQGVVAMVEQAKRSSSLDDTLDAVTGPPLLLVLDGIQDPHNLGACLRVADAAGVSAVVAPKDRAVGLNATVAKVASGAAETVPYFQVTNLARTLRELKERGIWIVGTDENAKDDLFTADFPESVAWVLGAEGEGMRRLTREHCDFLVRIPMQGEVESLNASVAAGIVLFESVRRRLAGGARSKVGKASAT
ncbi:MAG: 23S rRNA (guanosine(2251)-2'-O)-methyltransferase RlmB [Betaproteobacteria bacterium]